LFIFGIRPPFRAFFFFFFFFFSHLGRACRHSLSTHSRIDGGRAARHDDNRDSVLVFVHLGADGHGDVVGARGDVTVSGTQCGMVILLVCRGKTFRRGPCKHGRRVIKRHRPHLGIAQGHTDLEVRHSVRADLARLCPVPSAPVVDPVLDRRGRVHRDVDRANPRVVDGPALPECGNHRLELIERHRRRRRMAAATARTRAGGHGHEVGRHGFFERLERQLARSARRRKHTGQIVHAHEPRRSAVLERQEGHPRSQCSYTAQQGFRRRLLRRPVARPHSSGRAVASTQLARHLASLHGNASLAGFMAMFKDVRANRGESATEGLREFRDKA
jgi:hypothetical protein